MTDLRETLADVEHLIPRYSWEIMDEQQKDDLMKKVILPRYMKTTMDGVQLGPTVWSEMLGATMSAIESRVRRLRSSQSNDNETSARRFPASTERAARQVLREASPDEITALVDGLTPTQAAKIAAAADRKVQEHGKLERKKSETRLRADIGDGVSDALQEQQQIHDAEGELFKARRALRDAVALFTEANLEDIRDAWREDLLKTIDDLTARIEMCRIVIQGGEVNDDELAALLREGV